MGKIVAIVFIILVGSFVWYFVKGRVSGTHHRVRERALEVNFGRAVTAGPTTKLMNTMGLTLTLPMPPQQAGELIAHVASADDRVTAVRPEPGALVVEIDGSYPIVRAHLLADRTVIGVEALSWEMGFPQGATVWERLANAISTAASHQGVQVGRGTREFVKADAIGTGPEVWTVKA